MTELISPRQHSVQLLHTKAQQQFCETRSASLAVTFDWAKLTRSGEDHTAPAPVLFQWKTDRSCSMFFLSENEDFSNAQKISVGECSICLQNLKVAQTYYWKVNDSETGIFRTSDAAPRWIYAEGLTNIRDQGGWKTVDGKRIRQGLIYRGSEMEWQSYRDRDPSREPHVAITAAGLETMRQLSIRTDLDLRISAFGNLQASPLGTDVDLRIIPISPYDELFQDTYKPAVKEIFTLFANPDAYPIYYHCWGGADRTGTLAYLLNGLLGVPEEDLLLDYELTSLGYFGPRSRDLDYFVRFEEALRACDPSGTAQTRSRQFLLSCDVDQETLSQSANNLLELSC